MIEQEKKQAQVDKADQNMIKQTDMTWGGSICFIACKVLINTYKSEAQTNF